MTDASLIYEIDSSQAKSAAGELLKLGKATEDLANKSSKLLKMQRDSSGQFKSNSSYAVENRSAIESLARSYSPLMSAQIAYTKEVSRTAEAVRLGVITDSERVAQLARAKVSLDSAAAAQMQFGKTAQVSQGHVANLGYQINDIGMMMALGQSPFALMMQQGPQVAQIFGDMTAQGQNLGPTIAGAFTRMLNPMTALTLVAIGGTAALVQWGMSALGASEKAKSFDESLSALNASVTAINNQTKIYTAEGITGLIEKYGELNGTILTHVELMRQVDMRAALENSRAAIMSLSAELDGFFSTTTMSLQSMFNTNIGVANQLTKAMEDASKAGNFKDQLVYLQQMRSQILSLTGGIDNMTTEQFAFYKKVQDSIDAMMQLEASAPSANWMSAAISGVSSLGAAIRARIGEANALRALASTALPDERGSQRRIVHDATGYVRDNPLAAVGGGGGGGGGGSSEVAAAAKRAEELKTQFQSEYVLKSEQYALDQTALKTALDQKLITEQQYLMSRQQMQSDYYSKAVTVDQNMTAQTLSNLSSDFAQMNQLAGGGYDGLLRAQKAFAAASATINAYEAASQALRQPGTTTLQKVINAGKVLAAGLGFVSAIKGGGSKSGGGIASSATSAAAASARVEPEKQIYVSLEGPDWMVDMADSIISQIYSQSKDGRVVISRAGR